MYSNYTDEALITMLMENPSDSTVLETLTNRFRPTILGEALKYRAQLPYDTDDYLQEGRITLWQIAVRKNYKTGNFRNYFISAIRFHYYNLFRAYVLKNMIRIGGYEDIRGNTYEILVESDYVKTYREKQREASRKKQERKKELERAERERLGIPEPTKRSKLSEEELIARRRARSLAYYHAHADEMNQRAKDKRKAKAEERAAEKALEKAVRETERLAKKAAEKARKAAEREAKKAEREARKAAEKARKAAEREARKAAEREAKKAEKLALKAAACPV